jgi:iron complex transport system ATP-binding protein
MSDDRNPGAVPVLEAKGLSVHFDGNRVLHGISMKILRGEFVAVLGPNGAGKTTLIRALTGVLRDIRGDVFLCGKPTRSYRRGEFGRILSFLPQTNAVTLPFTVRDLVMMGRFPYLRRFELARPHDGDIVHDAMKLMGIERFGARHLMELSGGEVKRVFIAQAIAQEADILVLDEPTANLDINYQLEIFRMLQRFNREMGKTILLVTHDINHAARFVPRVVLLKEGELVLQGATRDMVTEENVRAVFGAEVRVRHDEEGRTDLML